ncbi:MAG: type II toxin-antitoxin system VapC family toxin [Limisphaerales bacterium]
MMQRVLLDASFWIALRDPREPWHGRARHTAAELLRQRTQFVFTTLIIAETYAHFSRSPLIRGQVLDDAQHNPALHWEPVSPADEMETTRLLRQHQDKAYSFCDAVSFVVMARLGLQRAAAFDDHFRQFGRFEVVP